MKHWCLIGVLCSWSIHPLRAEEPTTLTVRDTLAPAAAANDDERTCLDGLVWKPVEFTVTLHAATEDEPTQRVVRYPSPIDSGNAVNDKVSLIWYQAAEVPVGERRPAIIVVHESGSAMPVGKLFAKRFADKGAHAFLIHLPGYGLRRQGNQRPTGEQFLLAMRQSIADVRRARDVAAAMPGVDPDKVSLQGTSLGGFVSATTAGLDRGFDQVFIMLAGGDLVGLMERGEREVAELRRRLEQAGYTGEKLRDLFHPIEPNRLARRVDPQRTWLYSAEQDRVVPLANAFAWKERAGLDSEHHVRLLGDHVTTIIYLPVILDHVMQRVRPTVAVAP